MQGNAIVIGSGFTGLFIAVELARRGANVTVLESAPGPDGASSKIAGVVHTGARFAGVNPELAEACFNEWKWWKRNMRDQIGLSEGYYLFKREWEGSEEYLNRWTTSMNAIGIPFYEDEGLFNVEPRAKADRAFWVPEAAVDVKGALRSLLNYAVRLGANYVSSAELLDAKLNGDLYSLAVRAGSKEFNFTGHVFVAAGHEIPRALEPFGVKVEYKLTRGSHAIVNLRTSFIFEKAKQPSTGDLIVPVNGLTYIAPSSVEDINMPVNDEISGIIRSASEVFDLSHSDVLGAMTTYRIAITKPNSSIKFDYLHSSGPLTVAYSANMTCARRVAVSAVKGSGLAGLRDGVPEDYLGL